MINDQFIKQVSEYIGKPISITKKSENIFSFGNPSDINYTFEIKKSNVYIINTIEKGIIINEQLYTDQNDAKRGLIEYLQSVYNPKFIDYSISNQTENMDLDEFTKFLKEHFKDSEYSINNPKENVYNLDFQDNIYTIYYLENNKQLYIDKEKNTKIAFPIFVNNILFQIRKKEEEEKYNNFFSNK